MWTGTDGGNSDVCNFADFSSEEEDVPFEWNSSHPGKNIIGVMTHTYDDASESEDSEWEDAENRKVRKFVNHVDLECGDRPVADAASKLIMMHDGILMMGTSPDVIDHPKPTKNVGCDSAKRNIPVRKEAMTSMCLLPSTVLPGTYQQAELIDMNTARLDHQYGTCWYPDSNNHPGVYVCWKCRCLMALCVVVYHAW